MQPISIVLAEDDKNDQLILRKAFEEVGRRTPLYTVDNGVNFCSTFTAKVLSPNQAPTPGLILLDLNMPVMGGEETLAEIRADERFQHIDQTGMNRCYEQGANTFITKPASYRGFVEVISQLQLYWLNLGALPYDNHHD